MSRQINHIKVLISDDNQFKDGENQFFNSVRNDLETYFLGTSNPRVNKVIVANPKMIEHIREHFSELIERYNVKFSTPAELIDGLSVVGAIEEGSITLEPNMFSSDEVLDMKRYMKDTIVPITQRADVAKLLARSYGADDTINLVTDVDFFIDERLMDVDKIIEKHETFDFVRPMQGQRIDAINSIGTREAQLIVNAAGAARYMSIEGEFPFDDHTIDFFRSGVRCESAKNTALSRLDLVTAHRIITTIGVSPMRNKIRNFPPGMSTQRVVCAMADMGSDMTGWLSAFRSIGCEVDVWQMLTRSRSECFTEENYRKAFVESILPTTDFGAMGYCTKIPTFSSEQIAMVKAGKLNEGLGFTSDSYCFPVEFDPRLRGGKWNKRHTSGRKVPSMVYVDTNSALQFFKNIVVKIPGLVVLSHRDTIDGSMILDVINNAARVIYNKVDSGYKMIAIGRDGNIQRFNLNFPELEFGCEVAERVVGSSGLAGVAAASACESVKDAAMYDASQGGVLTSVLSSFGAGAVGSALTGLFKRMGFKRDEAAVAASGLVLATATVAGPAVVGTVAGLDLASKAFGKNNGTLLSAVAHMDLDSVTSTVTSMAASLMGDECGKGVWAKKIASEDYKDLSASRDK